MLLGPEDGEPFRDPDMDRSQAMQPGVAGGAYRDQQIGITVAGMPMVNMQNSGVSPPRNSGIQKRPGLGPFPRFRRSNPASAGASVALRAEVGDDRNPLAAGEWLLPGNRP
jgi:hypothetical protein